MGWQEGDAQYFRLDASPSRGTVPVEHMLGQSSTAPHASTLPQDRRRGKAGLVQTVLNVCKNCIGSAVLSLPLAFSLSGLLGGLLQLALVHVFSALGFEFIAQSTVHEGCSDTRSVAEHAFSSNTAGVCTEAIAMLYSLLAGAAFFNITGSFMPEILRGIHPAPAFDREWLTQPLQLLQHIESVLQTQTGAIVFVSLCISLPISLGRDLAFFSRFSAVGVIALLVAYAVLVQKLFAFGIAPDVVYGVASWHGIFKASPIIALCCSCHYNTAAFAIQLKNPGKLTSVTVASYAFCMLFYTAFGVAAYLRLGKQTPPNVLNAFGDNDKLASTARVALLLSVLLTWPLLFSSTKNSIRSLFFSAYAERVPSYLARFYYGISIIGFQSILGATLSLDRIFEIVRYCHPYLLMTISCDMRCKPFLKIASQTSFVRVQVGSFIGSNLVYMYAFAMVNNAIALFILPSNASIRVAIPFCLPRCRFPALLMYKLYWRAKRLTFQMKFWVVATFIFGIAALITSTGEQFVEMVS